MPTTWNLSDKGANINLTNSNLTAILNATTGNEQSVRSTTSKVIGKWYYEVTAPWANTIIECVPGIMTPLGNVSLDFPGETTQSYGFFYAFGTSQWTIIFNGGSTNISITPTVDNDVLGICLDLTNGFLYATLNGVNLLGNPVAETGGQAIALGQWYAAVGGARAPSFVPGMTGKFSNFSFSPPPAFNSWDDVTRPFAISTLTTNVAIKVRTVGV